MHARVLADAGWRVVVIDRRDHIGGNAFDEVLSGVRVHRYGPHLFHTNNLQVVKWLERFARWVPYTHRVKARLEDGRLVPLPVNRSTINAFHGVELADEQACREFLATLRPPLTETRNARDVIESMLGPEMTELFFARYTRKMWGLELEEIAESVVRRVVARFNDDDRYFPHDRYQQLPQNGYASLFEQILDSKNIEVLLRTPFETNMDRAFRFTFNSMSIDEYFGYEFGPLPYRSIRFHTHISDIDRSEGCTTINYTDQSIFTRETFWHNLPNAIGPSGCYIKTVEEPCSYEDNNFERYYPLRTPDNRYVRRYHKYKALANGLGARIQFIGRCGAYQYLDMDQVVNQSLMSARRWLQRHT